MRHQRRINHLSRTSEHRNAMLSNMATSLIMHKRIFTTLAKAKALRTFVEPLITKSKEDSTHSRRMVFSSLGSKEAVNELFREVSVKVANRPGGYTRIIRTGKRNGDNAEMAMIELVDFNPNLLVTKEGADKGKKRSRRGTTAKKKAEEQPVAAAPVAEIKETPATEEPSGELEVEDQLHESPGQEPGEGEPEKKDE